MSEVLYEYCGGLYVNLTNRCPCSCDFCIKNFTDGLGSSDSLLLTEEPSVSDVMEEMEQWDMDEFDEVVFCGYGEPTQRLPELLQIAEQVKDKYGKRTRINTIGLADLIWQEETAPKLEGLIDSVNVSMNEADEEKYEALCHPVFEGSYDAMLKYVEDIRKYVPDVSVSVVGCISRDSIEKCRQKAEDLGVRFRVR